jgi:tRNA (mo5U34)-methyltransferase
VTRADSFDAGSGESTSLWALGRMVPHLIHIVNGGGRLSSLSLADEVKSVFWYHSIDLGNGIVTPGYCGAPNANVLSLFDTIDFRGKKVLDVGCWDGLWAIEAEKRGATTVYATDKILNRTHNEIPSIEIALKALDSKIHYRSDLTVYDVEKLGVKDFDVVVFCGLFYHLKDPLLALARLRKVMKEGGIIIVEGEILEDMSASYARFYYRDWLCNDPTNWWVPTLPCLRDWVECSYFEILQEIAPENQASERIFTRNGEVLNDEPHGRVWMSARAVRRKDINYLGPDDELAEMDLENDA